MSTAGDSIAGRLAGTAIVKARPPPYDFEKGSSFTFTIPSAATGLRAS
jgi:hypothetical protein